MADEFSNYGLLGSFLLQLVGYRMAERVEALLRVVGNLFTVEQAIPLSNFMSPSSILIRC